MEQLLSRNRSEAGASLPEELNKALPTESKNGNSKSAPATQPTSFIDQYMENYQEDPEVSAADCTTGEAHETSEREVASPPRRKVDLTALRQDMDSFREVSVQSVQKALEFHAMKKERSGLAGRQAVTAVLVLMTIFVAAANIMGITEYPMLVSGLILGSAAAAAELCRRNFSVRSRVREMTDQIGVSGEDSSTVAVRSNNEEHSDVSGGLAAEQQDDSAVPAITHVSSTESDDKVESAPEVVTADIVSDDESQSPVDIESMPLRGLGPADGTMVPGKEGDEEYYEL